MQLDVEFVRSQFPVFQRTEQAGWAFFENAGGSYVPRQVLDRLGHFFHAHKVQPYGPFPSSIQAGQEMDEGYRCMAELLNTEEDALTLGPSTTLNCYVLAQAVRPTLNSGDEIVVTNQDHEANIGCWERLRETGAVVRQWEIDPQTGELDIETLKGLVNERTRLVCFSLCSNIVGTFQDAPAVTRIARQVGAISVADGVSFAPHRVVDVDDLGADVYVMSTYKTYGTHVGVMWIRPELFARIVCQGHYFNVDRPRYRMNPTGPQHAEIAALAGIGDYYDALHEHHFGEQAGSRLERAQRVFELVARHETELSNQLLDTLRRIRSVRVIGQTTATPDRRAPTISFVSDRLPASQLARALADRQIAARAGDFYARRCIEALQLERPEEGVLRISMVHYNTHEEVSRLANLLEQLL